MPSYSASTPASTTFGSSTTHTPKPAVANFDCRPWSAMLASVSKVKDWCEMDDANDEEEKAVIVEDFFASAYDPTVDWTTLEDEEPATPSLSPSSSASDISVLQATPSLSAASSDSDSSGVQSPVIMPPVFKYRELYDIEEESEEELEEFKELSEKGQVKVADAMPMVTLNEPRSLYYDDLGTPTMDERDALLCDVSDYRLQVLDMLNIRPFSDPTLEVKFKLPPPPAKLSSPSPELPLPRSVFYDDLGTPTMDERDALLCDVSDYRTKVLGMLNIRPFSDSTLEVKLKLPPVSPALPPPSSELPLPRPASYEDRGRQAMNERDSLLCDLSDARLKMLQMLKIRPFSDTTLQVKFKAPPAPPTLPTSPTAGLDLLAWAAAQQIVSPSSDFIPDLTL